MQQGKKKKGWFRWKIPLLAAILCAAWEMLAADKIDIDLIIRLLGKAPFAFTVLGIFYNWLIGLLKNMDQKKPSKIELVLVIPFFACFILAVVPPLAYVEQWLLPLFLSLLGYEFGGFALGYWHQETRLKRICTGRATAVVQDNIQARTDTRPGQASTKTYFPVLAYDVSGQRLERQYEHGQPRPMEVERRVEICYNPEKPEEFCFLKQSENKALTLGVPFALIMSTAAWVTAVLSIVYKWGV